MVDGTRSPLPRSPGGRRRLEARRARATESAGPGADPGTSMAPPPPEPAPEAGGSEAGGSDDLPFGDERFRRLLAEARDALDVAPSPTTDDPAPGPAPQALTPAAEPEAPEPEAPDPRAPDPQAAAPALVPDAAPPADRAPADPAAPDPATPDPAAPDPAAPDPAAPGTGRPLRRRARRPGPSRRASPHDGLSVLMSGEPAPAEPPRSRRAPRRRRLRRLVPARARLRRLVPGEAGLVLLAATVGYVSLGVFQTAYRGVHFGDALSRLGQALSVAWSADPHLAAVGFTFGPVPSLLLLPFLPLAAAFPVLHQDGVLVAVQAALFSAGSVHLVRGTLADQGVPRPARLFLATCFAVHPLVLVHAANGMSEAPMIFFLLLAARYLARWLDPATARHGQLLVVGTACSLAYLVRLEPVAAGIACTGLVAVVSFGRVTGDLRRRRSVALTDTLLVGAPFVATVVVWAVMGKVVIGQWLSYLGSLDFQREGRAEAIEELIGGPTLADRVEFLSRQLLVLSPLLALAVFGGLVVVTTRRDLRPLAAVATVGAVLAADAFALVAGRSFGYLRFLIAAVPLTVLLAGALATRPPLGSSVSRTAAAVRAGAAGAGTARSRVRWPSVEGLSLTAGSALAALLVVPGVVVSLQGVADPDVAPQEAVWLSAVRGEGFEPGGREQGLAGDVDDFTSAFAAARYVDGLDLPPGSVLVDTGQLFGVLTHARERDAYLATSDRTWERTLADPVAFDQEYVLVSDGGQTDLVAATYPQLFAEGSLGEVGTAELVETFESERGLDLRLYRLPAAETARDRGGEAGVS